MHLQIFGVLAQVNNGGGGWAIAGGMMIVFVIMAILASLFWVWMLIDALVNETAPLDKLVWFLVIFFLHLLGALIYFFVRRSNRGKPSVL